LKSPDFFNAKQFPSIIFKSTKVAKAGAKYQVTGDLTLHGTTKPITFEIEQTGSGKGPTGAAVAGVEATLKIKRSDFGMNKMIPMIGDDVTVIVSLEGGKS
jgi:polyisoprenoid-binding protein YceI